MLFFALFLFLPVTEGALILVKLKNRKLEAGAPFWEKNIKGICAFIVTGTQRLLFSKHVRDSEAPKQAYKVMSYMPKMVLLVLAGSYWQGRYLCSFSGTNKDAVLLAEALCLLLVLGMAPSFVVDKLTSRNKCTAAWHDKYPKLAVARESSLAWTMLLLGGCVLFSILVTVFVKVKEQVEAASGAAFGITFVPIFTDLGFHFSKSFNPQAPTMNVVVSAKLFEQLVKLLLGLIELVTYVEPHDVPKLGATVAPITIVPAPVAPEVAPSSTAEAAAADGPDTTSFVEKVAVISRDAVEKLLDPSSFSKSSVLGIALVEYIDTGEPPLDCGAIVTELAKPPAALSAKRVDDLLASDEGGLLGPKWRAPITASVDAIVADAAAEVVGGILNAAGVSLDAAKTCGAKPTFAECAAAFDARGIRDRSASLAKHQLLELAKTLARLALAEAGLATGGNEGAIGLAAMTRLATLASAKLDGPQIGPAALSQPLALLFSSYFDGAYEYLMSRDDLNLGGAVVDSGGDARVPVALAKDAAEAAHNAGLAKISAVVSGVTPTREGIIAYAGEQASAACTKADVASEVALTLREAGVESESLHARASACIEVAALALAKGIAGALFDAAVAKLKSPSGKLAFVELRAAARAECAAAVTDAKEKTKEELRALARDFVAGVIGEDGIAAASEVNSEAKEAKAVLDAAESSVPAEKWVVRIAFSAISDVENMQANAAMIPVVQPLGMRAPAAARSDIDVEPERMIAPPASPPTTNELEARGPMSGARATSKAKIYVADPSEGSGGSGAVAYVGGDGAVSDVGGGAAAPPGASPRPTPGTSLPSWTAASTTAGDAGGGSAAPPEASSRLTPDTAFTPPAASSNTEVSFLSDGAAPLRGASSDAHCDEDVESMHLLEDQPTNKPDGSEKTKLTAVMPEPPM